MNELHDRARELRKRQTLAEQRLWRNLRDRRLNGWKFRRQKPIAGYIVDFVCIEATLIVEADGGQHQEQAAYDDKRTRRLQEEGYTVLRFWNNDILRDTSSVLEKILQCLPPHPGPLPPEKGQGGEGVTQ
jgi:very-short-patch-repair endonuclease